jgi:hypothetical protein
LFHCTECLSIQFSYLNFLYNPALQGNWPHSYYWSLLHTWRWVCACYSEESSDYVFEIYMASNCTR